MLPLQACARIAELLNAGVAERRRDALPFKLGTEGRAVIGPF